MRLAVVGALLGLTGVLAPAPRLVAHLDVGGQNTLSVAAGGKLWVAVFGSDRLVRVDPSTNRVTARVKVGAKPIGVSSGGGSLWVDNSGSNTVTRIDAATGRVQKTIAVGQRPYASTYACDSVWVTDDQEGLVVRIDPATNSVATRIVVGAEPNGVVGAYGSVWVADLERSRVYKIDPATNAVVGEATVPKADWVTPAGGSLWVSSETGKVFRLDPKTLETTAAVAVGANPLASAVVHGRLWVPAIDGGEVAVVDPATARVVARIRNAGYGPIGVTPLGRDAWVTDSAGFEIRRFRG